MLVGGFVMVAEVGAVEVPSGRGRGAKDALGAVPPSRLYLSSTPYEYAPTFSTTNPLPKSYLFSSLLFPLLAIAVLS